MLQDAYFLAKSGADTAENEQHFAEILPKIGSVDASLSDSAGGAGGAAGVHPGGRGGRAPAEGGRAHARGRVEGGN